MKLVPVKNWVVAHALVIKPMSSIIDVNPARGSTRCYLLESVSSEAEAAGYSPGDLVVAQRVYDMFLGPHRVTFSIDEVFLRLEGAILSDFVDLNGKPIEGVAA